MNYLAYDDNGYEISFATTLEEALDEGRRFVGLGLCRAVEVLREGLRPPTPEQREEARLVFFSKLRGGCYRRAKRTTEEKHLVAEMYARGELGTNDTKEDEEP